METGSQMNTMQIVDFSNAVTNRRLALMLAVDVCKERGSNIEVILRTADRLFDHLEKK